MQKLVVVADDFGLCASVNDGIIDAYQNGIVTELSLMLGSPGTEDAIRKARDAGIETIGLHCLLTFWKDKGSLTRRGDYKQLFEEKTEMEIKSLFDAEVALFEKLLGRPPSHITSQYSIHGHPKLLPVVLDYCKRSGVPVRIPHPPLLDGNELLHGDSASIVKRVRDAGCKTTDRCCGFMLGEYDEMQGGIIKAIADIGEGESAEVLLHPGYESPELVTLTSMVRARPRDVALAKDDVIKRALEKSDVSLVTFKDAAR